MQILCPILRSIALAVVLLGSVEPPSFSTAAEPKLTPVQQEQLAEAIRLGKEANKLRDDGKVKESLEIWRKRLKILHELFGPIHDEAIGDLETIAEIEEDQADFAAAIRTRTELVELKTKAHGTQHWKTNEARWILTDIERIAKLKPDERKELVEAERLSNDAFKAFQAKKYQDAVELNRRVLAIRKRLLGEQGRDFVKTLDYLGVLLHSAGDLAAARPYYEQALAARQARLGDAHPDTARSHRDVAVAHDALGYRANARQHYEKALPAFQAVYGDVHLETVTTRMSLATLLVMTGDHTAARPLLEFQVMMVAKEKGENDLATAHSREVLGLTLASVGNTTAAKEQYEKATEIRRKVQGETHPATAEGWSNIGLVFQAAGDYKACRPYFEKALSLLTAGLGENHADTLAARGHLAGVLGALGELKQARNELEIVLAAQEKGPKSRPVEIAAIANTKSALGMIMLRSGAPREAEPLIQSALDTTEKVYGREHSRTGLALQNLALVQAADGRENDAVESADKARRIARRHGGRVLLGLSETEQLAYLRFDQERALHQCISLAFAERANLSIAGRSAAWVLNGKATAVQALGERNSAAGRGANIEIDRLHSELVQVRARLAGLALAHLTPDREQEHRQVLDKLAERERDLARKIGQIVGRTERTDLWIELAEVRKTLPPNAVLVEIAHFNEWNLLPKEAESTWRDSRYAAWIIPPAGKGEVRLIDLGEAESLEDAVWAARKELQAAPGNIARLGEVSAEIALRKVLTPLAKRLLGPLVEHIGNAEEWILSPDGDLWLAPWAALPLKDGRFAVEGHRIRYVVTGRDLARTGYGATQNAAVIFADPDFGPPEVGAVGLRGRWQPLEGTRKEAIAIAPMLERLTKAVPVQYMGAKATEEAFKALDRPRVLVLSTHGFFLPEPDSESLSSVNGLTRGGFEWVSQKRRPAPKSRIGENSPDNPLLRCGLVLAGANRSAEKLAGSEDGVLTGLEVLGTDLRGCKLVVLSACETGLGERHTGEGVSGLRQAFQLAGAESVLATLWKIPDQETAELVTGIFDRLVQSKSPADALCQAQIAVIKARRAKGEAAHPFYWAAFTVTGSAK